MRILGVAGVAALVLGLLAGPVPAHRQTFPARNGPLVFGFGANIVTENPDGSGRRTVIGPSSAT